MSGYRQAAMALHHLNDADRKWILAELPGDDQAILENYLGELKQLGFLPDVAILNELFISDCQSSVNSIDCVRQATAEQMLAVLEGEPCSLIAQLIAGQEWPWKASFLHMIAPARQAQIHCIQSNFSGPALARQEFLIDAIAERLNKRDRCALMPSRLRNIEKPRRIRDLLALLRNRLQGGRVDQDHARQRFLATGSIKRGVGKESSNGSKFKILSEGLPWKR